MDIGDYRREYMSEGIDGESLHIDPVQQFEIWFKQATDAGIQDSNAFSLATATEQGMPSVRTVLLKLFDERGFVFFTNYNSRKAKEIKENSKAAMLFPWLPLNRQVRIEGHVEKISSVESFKYFTSRPRGSQIGAWCSDQSEVIESRSFLEQKYHEAAEKFRQGNIPLPSFWGGYRIVPSSFEFWQGRESRLHDRLSYFKTAEGDWTISRLAP
ncbi:pyridoxamine 5'-phosphate oxidase [Oleiphilus sp. HI0009]|uniref:pyridoxamine 5'-phosphate oxidase n=1 Tax=unclassified Oleiphilus TaxID=2631174 RepID=UPI0007C3FC55|nr:MULTISPECIES: pyridoxamine 5'-phosphate oxidase [unclassified Oleiphilus]KZX83209.1 pyridoxamine 5'-phosphate oxidase [Oleiphilus sp. HI0009]MCH2158214.1 pyridoxamine 5'-phosphate oxidase [Oleiphilaceae bacterium]KZY64948.1 pyridoxamine 5'-phosphate oxidase [Oleiphilus sp. HI0066]KZY65275.1 pyridoxamine 5'-phosphate oxidase [Oleiphilus sp. HI0066]KZY68505.1 pyridoxamine 5'-phosphate oxidase [Oleiphilus sp. HI0067]